MFVDTLRRRRSDKSVKKYKLLMLSSTKIILNSKEILKRKVLTA